ncbi:hypothetical protein O3M35_003250 [Rhynocoris fuscipes]|uniref:Uncharacterized protein n=1 Tax=Rhynocoris fuscipes TaxID=488301 RepID=A0AAW1CMF0_9HEMI
MNEFCASFQPTKEDILNSQGYVEEMSSGCNGVCSYCQNCPANCYNRILRACKEYLNMSSTKILSSLKISCHKFVNKSSP